MDRDRFIKTMTDAKLYDLTQSCSIFTPPWPGEKSLEVHFFKRVTGAYGGDWGRMVRSSIGAIPWGRIW